jgi:hypothetical protein
MLRGSEHKVMRIMLAEVTIYQNHHATLVI